MVENPVHSWESSRNSPGFFAAQVQYSLNMTSKHFVKWTLNFAHVDTSQLELFFCWQFPILQKAAFFDQKAYFCRHFLKISFFPDLWVPVVGSLCVGAQMLPDVARLVPDAARCCRMVTDAARDCQPRWCQVLPDASRWCQMLPDVARWSQMLQIFRRCYQYQHQCRYQANTDANADTHTNTNTRT